MTRREMRLVEIHQHNIGMLPDFQTADLFAQAQAARAANRRHFEGLTRGNLRRIARDAFDEQGSQAHFFPHIEVVVGSRAIGRDAGFDAAFDESVQRRKARSQFQIGSRVVRDAQSSTRYDLQIALIQMNAMRAQKRPFQRAHLMQRLNRRRAPQRFHVAQFAFGFLQMRVKQATDFARRIEHFLPMIARASVKRVRRERRRKQPAKLRVLDLASARESNRVGDALFWLRQDSQKNAADNRAHLAFCKSARALVVGKIHVGARCRAAAQHFRARQKCPVVNIVGRKIGFQRPDFLLQPRFERHIVGVTAQKRHRGVRVRVDQSGQRHQMIAADGFVGLKRRSSTRSAHINDAIVFDMYRGVFNDFKVRITSDGDRWQKRDT